MTTRFADHLLTGTHASRPAANTVPAGTLYSCTTHGLVYQSDGVSTWSTWATLGGAGGGTAIAGTCQFRLTLETAVPVSTTDQTGKSTLYLTPVNGNNVVTYDSSVWTGHASAEVSLALSGLTSGKNYDVFAYNNAGTLTLELSAAWTNDTTRADALALQDGVPVKSADHSRLHVGTIRTTGTTTTEDSMAKRFVWNRYNPARRKMKNATETTDTWNYTTATFRQANANTANQLDYVTGDAATLVDAVVRAQRNNSGGVTSAVVGIGVDSTSTNSADMMGGQAPASSSYAETTAMYSGTPGLGRHFLAWLEHSNASGTTQWVGDIGSPTTFQSGITGTIWN